jgi:hypothetical protein
LIENRKTPQKIRGKNNIAENIAGKNQFAHNNVGHIGPKQTKSGIISANRAD